DERSRDGGPPRRARRPLEEDRLVARGLGEKRLGSGEHLAQSPSRDRLELERVVRADEANLRPMLRLELPQAALVPPARAAVLLHEPLVEAQAWRATGTADVQLAVPEVRVAGQEEPSAVLVHRDAGVAERVAPQRHERDLVVQSLQRP